MYLLVCKVIMLILMLIFNFEKDSVKFLKSYYRSVLSTSIFIIKIDIYTFN